MEKNNYLIIGILFPILAFLISLPGYIPEFQNFSFFVVLCFFIIASYCLYKFFQLSTENRSGSTERISHKKIPIVISSIIYLVMFIVLTLSMFEGLIFGNEYRTNFESKKFGAIIYVYDSSFFEHSSKLKIKNSKIPILTKEIYFLPEVKYDTIEFKEVEDGIFITGGNIKILYIPYSEEILEK